jgi:methylglutaconyl-CoA hydratase
VARIVNDLATSAPGAVAAAKALIAAVSSTATPAAAIDYTIEAIAERRVSSEGQEGMRAFLEKRPPSWIA